MFYDEIAEYYDQMIPFEKRVGNLQKMLKPYIEQHQIKSALDIGSATGATCIALANLGVKSAGLEQALRMVKIAREMSKKYGHDIQFRSGDMMDRVKAFEKDHDAVFVLANTISHLLDKKSLKKAFTNFRRYLANDGKLVIQLLNYTRILKDRKRIVKIYNSGKHIFVRFYDFKNSHLNFNILVIENDEGVCDYELHSVPLRAWKGKELKDVLMDSGFKAVKYNSNLKGDKFIPAESNDLLITCKAG